MPGDLDVQLMRPAPCVLPGIMSMTGVHSSRSNGARVSSFDCSTTFGGQMLAR